ncbi:DNA-binding protein [Dysgonomonas sp. 521]|uniref:helix-turn-helix domain-containing protein n=1 Tax=Dysgonomonas sp. 521 TaxID=2302932 RepID=UPI0013D8C0C9|nr:helix-turn-helix domain-containing protein [Dysgonomonas sp. 521]NDV96755.1 DNA-binding protein [Dysgonomonas sp. 521]
MGIVIMKSGDFQALMDRIEAIEKYIYQVEPKQPPLQEIWLDNEVVCSYLKISKRTLQRYRSNGVITYSLIGKKTYYTISEIKRLLEEKRIQRNVGSLDELAAKGLMTLPKD